MYKVSDLKKIVEFLESEGIDSVEVQGYGSVCGAMGHGYVTVCFSNEKAIGKMFPHDLEAVGIEYHRPTVVRESMLESGERITSTNAKLIRLIRNGEAPKGAS